MVPQQVVMSTISGIRRRRCQQQENGAPAGDDEHHPNLEEMNHPQVPAENGAPAGDDEHHPNPEEMNHPQATGFGDVSEAEVVAQWRIDSSWSLTLFFCSSVFTWFDLYCVRVHTEI